DRGVAGLAGVDHAVAAAGDAVVVVGRRRARRAAAVAVGRQGDRRVDAHRVAGAAAHQRVGGARHPVVARGRARAGAGSDRGVAALAGLDGTVAAGRAAVVVVVGVGA